MADIIGDNAMIRSFVDNASVPIAFRWAENLLHPYPRYGLAVALMFHSNGKPLSELNENELREALAQAIESGLNRFRMETQDDPKHQQELRYQPIALDKLRADTELVSGSLAAQGKYLYPSIIATDKQVRGTFVDANKIIRDLRDRNVPLHGRIDLKRSFVPVSGEINNGGKEKIEQKGTLFEAACATSATVAFEKPSALAEGRNTGIFPDLGFSDLCEFVRVFRQFQSESLSLLNATSNKDGKFKRPPLHDGNYPGAPRESAFGAVGLLAAMGYWASRATNTTRQETFTVLDALRDKPLYLVSYDNVSQAQFSHYVIELAKTGNLRRILNEFFHQTRPYMVYDEPYLRHNMPAVRLLFFATSRFLQRFDAPSFRDFLATRAEYPPSTDLLLGAYFMQAEKIPRHIVESARALGQWINRTAYFVAEEDTDKTIQNRNQAVRKAKAKVLVEFESAVMSADSPEDMLHRVSTRAGRLLQSDAPSEATAYYDAAAAGEITFKTAQHLLIAYLRLRAVKTPGSDIGNTGVDSTDSTPTDMAEDDSDLAG